MLCFLCTFANANTTEGNGDEQEWNEEEAPLDAARGRAASGRTVRAERHRLSYYILYNKV